MPPYDEVVEYLRPVVAELLEVGKSKLEREHEAPDNAAAKSWATSYETLFYAPTEFDEATIEFWTTVDSYLDKKGVLMLANTEMRPRRNG